MAQPLLSAIVVSGFAYISKAVEAHYDISLISTARAILELVFIRSGCLNLNDMINGLCISACSFFVPVNFFIVCVPCVRFS